MEMSDIQNMNLHLLLLIRDHLVKDRLGAIHRFQLSAEQASKLSDLSLDRIQILVANMRQVSLFTPREDFIGFLEAPPGLALVLSAIGRNKVAGAPLENEDRGRKAQV